MKTMIHRLHWARLILAGTILVACSPSSLRAQENAEVENLKKTVHALEQTVQALTNEVSNLKKQQQSNPVSTQPVREAETAPGVPTSTAPGAVSIEKTPVPTDELADSSTPVPYQNSMKEEEIGAPRPGNAPLDPTYQGFMPIFGTKTWIKLGGYAKLDGIMDSTKVGNPNMFITSRIPVEGEPDFDKGEHFAMHAKQTRLNFELRAPTPIGSLKVFYENDFFNNNDQPNMDYRLRHFYGQVANITVGQTWTTFYDPDANPDTIDFEGPGALPVLRQPQVRYTLPIQKDAMYWSVALEQPKNDLDLSNLPGVPDGRNRRPDFTTALRYEGKPGHVQVAAVARSLSFDNTVGPTDTEWGWGINMAGALNVLEGDNVMASVSVGDGIGRYIQDLPGGSAGVVTAGGQIETMEAWGAMLAYKHLWSEKFRSTVSYSYVDLETRADQSSGGFAFDHTHYVQGNLIWAPTKNFYIGAEYLYGKKEARNGNEGDDHRVQVALQYKLMR